MRALRSCCTPAALRQSDAFEWRHQGPHFNSVLDELQHLPVSDGSAPDGTALVHGDAFGKAGITIRPRIGNEGRNDTVIDAPDINASMKAGVVAVLPWDVPILRIGNVQDVVAD